MQENNKENAMTDLIEETYQNAEGNNLIENDLTEEKYDSN